MLAGQTLGNMLRMARWSWYEDLNMLRAFVSRAGHKDSSIELGNNVNSLEWRCDDQYNERALLMPKFNDNIMRPCIGVWFWDNDISWSQKA